MCFADDATGYEAGMDAGDLSAEQIEECLANAKKINEMFYDRVVIYDI